MKGPEEPAPSTNVGSDLEPTPANVGALLEGLRPRLERLLALRFDRRLSRRVDPGDVLQETFAEVVQRLDEYLAKGPMPFYLWVRFLTVQKLARVHHRHLGTALRDVRREVTPRVRARRRARCRWRRPSPSPAPLPSKEIERREMIERVSAALEKLDDDEREVLALRYFERLSNEETRHRPRD